MLGIQTKKSFQNKVVVITGATAGVGRATAREFARKGAKLAILARGSEGLESTREELTRLGSPEVLALRADVAECKQVEEAASRVETELGPIDVWVNNAMTSVFSPVKEMTAEEFKRVTEVTYLGYVHGTLCALDSMLPRNEGVIVQVGSALSYRSIPLQSAYCAAKHAIKGFTESLRTELLHDGSKVEITLVQLPAVNTPQFGWVKSRLPNKAQPVPPIYQPEVPARAIVYAAGHPKKEYWVGTSAAATILGQKFFSTLMDHYLARTGYQSQQTDEPRNPLRPHNLWAPVQGRHSAHGSFDGRSRSFSGSFWLSRNRGLLAGLVSGAALLMAAGRLYKSRPQLEASKNGPLKEEKPLRLAS